MSNIDAQIKALQLKKKKIDYISYISDLVKNDTKCIDFKEVQKDVVDQIEPFLIQLMTAIETDSQVTPTENTSIFTEDEIKILKALVVRASKIPEKQTTTPAHTQPLPPSTVPEKPKAELSNTDKMNFSLENRHLANKRVSVVNDKETFQGLVVGLDAPHVIVRTDTGPTIQVPLKDIRI